MSNRRYVLPRTGVLALVIAAGTYLDSQNGLSAEETCGDYGTAVTFVDSPAEAAKRALKEAKLVFVLHVSGNFEVSEYT